MEYEVEYVKKADVKNVIRCYHHSPLLDWDIEYLETKVISKKKDNYVDAQKVNQLISTEELLRQTAEEAAELAQSALNLIRARIGTTPVSEREAIDHLSEEIADVENCIRVLYSRFPEICPKVGKISKAKMKRWKMRIERKNEVENRE